MPEWKERIRNALEEKGVPEKEIKDTLAGATKHGRQRTKPKPKPKLIKTKACDRAAKKKAKRIRDHKRKLSRKKNRR